MFQRLSPAGRKPLATYGIIAACVGCFLIDRASAVLFYGFSSSYSGLLTQWGMRYNPAIAEGQVWRLLTPAFLHAGITHLLFNMFALAIWGPVAETLYGRWKYLLILTASAVMGSALGFAFSGSASVGASGALFGLFGSLLAIRRQNRAFYDRTFGMHVLIFAAISLVSGFITPSIDNYGHIGGLVGGYLAGVCLGFGTRRLRRLAGAGACLLYVALLAVCMYIGFARFGGNA